MSNTTVPISEWCKEIRVALARKEMNLKSVADEIGYSYTTITALISGRIVKDNYLDIAKKINEVLEVNVLPENEYQRAEQVHRIQSRQGIVGAERPRT